MQPVRFIFIALSVLLLCTGAECDDRDDATGDWNGLRSWLEEQHGLHIDVDYTAESFNGTDDLSYRGNVDLTVTIDAKKIGLSSEGILFIYGQHAHGSGVSDELSLLMPVSNLEAESFTQLSEFWLRKAIGQRFRLRLGKQDANRDFGNPRFGGNFVNSSFGVLPGTPMPSFPTPGLGVAIFFEANKWLELRSGLYEGTPRIGSFGESAFEQGAGLFGITSIVFLQNSSGRLSGLHQFGAWSHSGLNRSGLFGVYDLFVSIKSNDPKKERSFQIFARTSWSPEISESADAINTFVGGGFTAHDFFGDDNTIGLGVGRAIARDITETFVELFIKVRQITWLTFEPGVQLYFTPAGQHFVWGLRTKLKL